MEPPWEGGTKVYINGPGHMTKMATMPFVVKTLKSLLLNRQSYDLETWHVHHGLKLFKICINDDLGFTLTYFTARSNLIAYMFEWGKLLQSHFIMGNLQQRTNFTE